MFFWSYIFNFVSSVSFCLCVIALEFHFEAVRQQLLLNPPLFLPKNSVCSIELSLYDTFQACLASLQTDKAMAGDGIPPSFSEKQQQLFLNHYIIFFFSVFNNLLPTEWLNHYITPIPKSGDRSIATNYRPISLLSSDLVSQL